MILVARILFNAPVPAVGLEFFELFTVNNSVFLVSE